MAKDAVADALRDTLISPNVADSNMEPANLVDAIDSLRAAIRFAGLVIGPGAGNGQFGGLQELSASVDKHAQAIHDGLTDVAESIKELAAAIRDSKQV